VCCLQLPLVLQATLLRQEVINTAESAGNILCLLGNPSKHKMLPADFAVLITSSLKSVA